MSNEPIGAQQLSFPSSHPSSQAASFSTNSYDVNANEFITLQQFEPAQSLHFFYSNIFPNASSSTVSNHSAITLRSNNPVVSWEQIPSPKLSGQETNVLDEDANFLATSHSFSTSSSSMTDFNSTAYNANVVENPIQSNQFLFTTIKTPIISFIEESGKPLKRSTFSDSSRTEEYGSQEELQKRKTNLACDSCRKTHRKCYFEHGEPPCKLCIKKGIECTFDMRKKKPEISKQKEFIMETHGKKRKTTDATSFVRNTFQSVKKSKSESPPTTHTQPLLNTAPTTSSSPENTTIAVPTTENTSPEAPTNPPDRNYFYLTSLISQFVRNYEQFIHPDHSVLPISTDNFIGIVPDLVNNMYGTPSRQEKEDLFLLNCILANSANAMGDLPRAKDFSVKAREYVGMLFDVFDPRVAGAFVLFSYLNFGWCNLDKAAYYAKIAMTNYEMYCKMVESSSSSAAAIVLDRSDLHLNCIVAVAYTMLTFEDKMEYFNKLLNNGTRKIDAIWAIVGQCEAYLDYGKVTNWDSLVSYLFQALSLINIADPNEHVTMLHELLVYSVLARALNEMDTNSDLEAKLSNRKMALQWAIKSLEILLKPTGKFLCVGVVCNAASSIGGVFILNHDWHHYQILNNFLQNLSLNFPLVNMYINILQKKYNNEQQFIQLPQTSTLAISQQSQQPLL